MSRTRRQWGEPVNLGEANRPLHGTGNRTRRSPPVRWSERAAFSASAAADDCRLSLPPDKPPSQRTQQRSSRLEWAVVPARRGACPQPRSATTTRASPPASRKMIENQTLNPRGLSTIRTHAPAVGISPSGKPAVASAWLPVSDLNSEARSPGQPSVGRRPRERGDRLAL
jgi:hypothetical protein